MRRRALTNERVMRNNNDNLSWLSIVRLGLVQTALGAIVVLTTSTLNRIMVVELALPAMIPGALVTLHHAMQLLRPRMGHGSDIGQRRTPWIIGGMGALAVGGVGAALATVLMTSSFAIGMIAGVISFALIGCGVSAAGTSLLVLMAKRVAAERRAAAATTVWMMMIAGFAITATVAGKMLDPFSSSRLLAVAAAVSCGAWLLSTLAIWGVEGKAKPASEEWITSPSAEPAEPATETGSSKFLTALKQVWAEPDARRFTLFILISMLAYSAQDLILEPFAGSIFAFTPGASTKLSGTQHGGVFTGMLLVAVMTTVFKKTKLASLKGWVVSGCIASGFAMLGLVIAGTHGGHWPLKANVFVLGVTNGAFSIAAIGAMMTLANQGRKAKEGVRMGLWGAAQAIAFGVGGFAGTVLADAAKWALRSSGAGAGGGAAYSFVFALEALGFFVAASLALRTAFEKKPAPSLVIEGPSRAAGSGSVATLKLDVVRAPAE